MTPRPAATAVNPARRDRSARFASVGVLAASVICALFAFQGEYGVEVKILLLFWLAGGAVLCVWAWGQVRKDPTLSVVLGPLIWYYYFAFVLKAALAAAPDAQFFRYWLGVRFHPTDLEFQRALPLCIATVSAAILGIVGSGWALRSIVRIPVQRPGAPPRMVVLPMTIAFALGVKYATHHVYGWGVPGFVAAESIPVVTGVLVFFSRVGIFALVTAYLYLAVIRARTMAHLGLALAAALGYVLMDLSIGSKYSLIYVAIVCLYVLLEYRRLYGSLPRVMLAVTTAAFAVVATLYKFVNVYRSGRLRAEGMSYRELMQFAADHASSSTSTFGELYNRINGYDNFQGAIAWGERLQMQWADLITSTDLTNTYTALMIGISDAVTAMGSTQPSVYSLLAGGNIFAAFPLSLALTSAAVFLFIGGSFSLLRHAETRRIMAIDLAIFFVYLQFGSGNFLFFAKEFLVMMLCVVFVDRLVFRIGLR